MSTSFTTLTPGTRSRDEAHAGRALATPLCDPPWTLGRQWQTGELHAEDAGSAVGVELSVESVGITELQTPAQTVEPADPAAGPLQLAVDAEPVPPLDMRPLGGLAAAGL